ncbi:MAG: hypothetical protein ACKOSQ_04240 [Planctomycetaceae bacterium]
MGDTHRIRLQAAWDVAAGGRTWTRSFGRPTGVGPGDRVWLVIERPAARSAAIDGRPLAAVGVGDGPWRHALNADLRERHELRLEFAAPPGPVAACVRVPLPEAAGCVWLEIEADE